MTPGAGRVTRQLLVALVTSHFGVSLLAAPPAAERESPQFQALPLLRSSQRHLLVRAEINGKPALLGVDTGASLSAIATKRRKHFGVTSVRPTSDLPAQLQVNDGFNRLTSVHHLRLGALTLIDEPMVAIDLSWPAKAAQDAKDPPIDGLIGTDILFPTQAILDCKEQVLIMKLNPEAPGSIPGLDFRGWRGVPIRVSKTWNLYVESKLNGKAAQLMIDTGAFATLLDRSFARALRLPLEETDFTSALVNVKKQEIQSTTIRRFAVGPLVEAKKFVGVMDLAGIFHEDLRSSSPPIAGLLGSEFLLRHHAIVDFGSRTLYLKL